MGLQPNNYETVKSIIQKQEEQLRFDCFSHEDAWALGCFIVKRIQDASIDLTVAITKTNGHILFQYATEKTSKNNQNWMKRKFNTVCLMEKSSLGAWVQSLISGNAIKEHGLNDYDYVFCGGGFPIRLKTGEMIAVLTVSNLPHQQDHMFIADALSEWLKVDGVEDILPLFT